MYDAETFRYLNDKINLGLLKYGVPESLHDGLRAYLMTGRPTGSFLEAVLSNDLLEACKRADMQNRRMLFDIVNFLYNIAPSGSFGSAENVRAYKQRGLDALRRTTITDDDAELCQRCRQPKSEVMAREGDVEYCGHCGFGR